MAIDQTGKQYNIVVALVGFSSDLGSRLAALEEEIAEYNQAGPPFSTLDFSNATIKHLDSNEVAAWVNAWNALTATDEFTAFRASMRKAAP